MDVNSLSYAIFLLPATFIITLITVLTAWIGWQLFINN
jgi:hypothetical protein